MTYQTDEKLLGGFGAPHWGFSGPAGTFYARRKWFEPHWVYVIASGDSVQPVKIGMARSVTDRIKQFEAGNPHGLRVLHAVKVCVGTASQVERTMHSVFADAALGREWFELPASAVISTLDRLADRAVVAARRFYREQATAEHRAAKAVAREERQRQAARLAAEARARARRREEAAERARWMAVARHEAKLGPPPLPAGVIITGAGRKATLARYKAARGLVD